ncbi:hypothetical protein NBRC110019_13650 [Neptunitalea chrysea]|uniref:DUF4861 domain-containing protein n=1 Tax=Neptunitalea chrysea TaxID=1647581 RepID=A0A9W6EUZ6_9FLAO|nr:DUF4861 family protein [Neptunitalea chrysea]GLB52326.1 hypothetical protein NBRC110019_13650 [Neptunitalea chrysea]
MIFKKYIIQMLSFVLLGVIGCTDKEGIKVTVEVSNPLNFNRTEIVAIPVTDLSVLLNTYDESSIVVKDIGAEKYLYTQWIDNDSDGKNDELLFQASVGASQSASYTILADSTVAIPETDVVAYSRFVPERTDDYTWENDKVAFRTYGPDAQQRAEEGRENGTLSSGIDLWLKRTDKSIINEWYKGYQTDPMFYHHDKGEGYDPYHVGGSRGTGGIGIWENDSIYVSKNFISYKTIADGPLRTVFELNYAPWSPYEVRETKRITLDLGTNFSKFEIALKARDTVPNYAIGITLHENGGAVKIQPKKGCYRYWEKIDDAYIGEGIVIDVDEVISASSRVSEVKDQSNLLILAKPTDKLTYYAGFAWVKSNQVTSVEDWDKMLEEKAAMLKNPLTIIINK